VGAQFIAFYCVCARVGRVPPPCRAWSSRGPSAKADRAQVVEVDIDERREGRGRCFPSFLPLLFSPDQHTTPHHK